MYNESSLSVGVIPPVVATGTIAMLPATGADTITTLAGAVLTGLATWAVIYICKTKITS